MAGSRLTGRKADVVEGELANPGVELEEERERLANATGGTEDGDLGGLQSPCQHMPCQLHLARCSRCSKKLLNCLGASECVPGGPTQRKRGAGPGRKLAWQRTW